MEGRIDTWAEVVAGLSRAPGAALDPTTILQRTMAALVPAVPVAEASVWLADGSRTELAAHHPVGGTPVDDDTPNRHTVDLVGAGRRLGQLIARPDPGDSFSETDRALLEVAGGQIAGALERSRLFQEVMELERLKSDFIARVSHELRTPITIINGFLDTLLTHADDLDAGQRDHMLQRSLLAASRLSGLIEELLLLSRLDAGILTPAMATTDIATVLAAVRDASSEPAHVLVASPGGASLRTDAALLTRALGLLVDNAIKYGTDAEVTVLAPDDARSAWVIEVADQGTGFAADVVDTAFEMFTRSQTVTAVPGLGVGLPIARTIVEILDGKVAIVADHPGTGALVRVTLPA